jgi:hypothetical protein
LEANRAKAVARNRELPNGSVERKRLKEVQQVNFAVIMMMVTAW